MLSLGQFKLTDPQSMISQCQLLIYYGDSLYENQEYKRAEVNWNPVWCEILNNLLSLIKPGCVSMIESQQTRVCLKIYILTLTLIPGKQRQEFHVSDKEPLLECYVLWQASSSCLWSMDSMDYYTQTLLLIFNFI